MPPINPEDLRALAAEPIAIEHARATIENRLLEWRESRLSIIGGNGLVVREADGECSSVMRMSTRDAVTLTLQALADFLEKETD